MEIVADHTLDLREAISPLALLKVSQMFRAMKSGKTMEILGSDLDTKKDLFKILPAASYTLVDMKEHKSFYRIRLRKLT